uniref:Large ribosomal subunit protein bL20c n=1 Tax=Trachelomonas grandis TaxID=215769 RepID=A0A385UNI9_9EUGL|nr:ribosomal protein L20 [Trachelomonas grandis]
MIRIKRSTTAKKRHKKILKLAKNYEGSKSKLFRTSNQQILKSLKYSYIGRKKRKTNYKRIWIKRINIICKAYSRKYNETINNLKKNTILINRKILSKILLNDNKTAEKIRQLK